MKFFSFALSPQDDVTFDRQLADDCSTLGIKIHLASVDVLGDDWNKNDVAMATAPTDDIQTSRQVFLHFKFVLCLEMASTL